MQQHRYTTAEAVTQNVGRIESIVLMPGSGVVEIAYVSGDDTGGNFTQKDQKVVRLAYEELPAAAQLVLADLETKALNYASSNGIFPSGSVEPV